MTKDILNTPKQPGSAAATETSSQQQVTSPAADLSTLSTPEQFGRAIDLMLNTLPEPRCTQQSTLGKFGSVSIGAVHMSIREVTGS